MSPEELLTSILGKNLNEKLTKLELSTSNENNDIELLFSTVNILKSKFLII
jgi:hypothetical protein